VNEIEEELKRAVLQSGATSTITKAALMHLLELRHKLLSAPHQVFCFACGKVWTVFGHHPGKSVCAECEKKFNPNPWRKP
jgi:hypothetical protein